MVCRVYLRSLVKLFFSYRFVDSDNKIAEDVHVVNKCLIRSWIRVEILVHVSVGEEFGAHVVQVVTLLEMSVVCPKDRIVEQAELLLQAVKLVEGLALELVSKPGGEVSLLVSPGNCVRHRKLGHRAECCGSLCRGEEIDSSLDALLSKCTQDIEDSSLLRSMLAERLVVHEEVHYIPLCCIHPSLELLGSERPLAPVAVSKTECDVVAELVVAEQEPL